MRLANPIRFNVDRLVIDWVAHASQRMPAAAMMTVDELEDSSQRLFLTFSKDMEASQTPLEQFDKSVGKKASVLCPITRHAMDHADQRTAHGFSTTDIAFELRVDPQNGERNLCEEVIRFNEAVGVSLPRLNTRPARSRDLFLAVAGHDMRDPLSSITPSSQRLLVEENLPDTSRRAARQIHGSAARLGRKLPQKLIDGDMGRVIQEVLEEMRVACPSAEVDLHRSGDLRGTWDFGRLAQVVSNPCGIALQHGDATRPTDSQLDLRSVGTRHA